MSICAIPECDKPCKARKLCTAHYKRLLRHGDPTMGRRQAELHGEWGTYLYILWNNIINRTKNRKDSINWYGDVEVYKDWQQSYIAFRDYVRTKLGDKPSKEHSLDRIENSKGYIPGNIRWADKSQQSLNRDTFKTNTSGHTGAFLDKRNGHWKSEIKFRGEIYRLGIYDTPEEAGMAYLIKKNQLKDLERLNNATRV